MTRIDTLTEKAQKAQAALDEARQAEAAEHEQLEERRRHAASAAQQSLLDDYDPVRLAADVVETFEAMVDAAETGGGDLTALTVDHLAAIRRQVSEGQAANDLQANGATPPDRAINAAGRLRGPSGFTTHRGGPIGAIDAYTSKVLAEAIELGARRRIETEQAQRSARVRAAVEAVS
jgi:hypothetical protein